MNTNIISNCNNCGKQGHLFHQCKLPITSYGIVAFSYHNSDVYFLMIRRKDSFGYIEFIRGKYSLTNLAQIVKIMDEMSMEEKIRLTEKSFEEQWATMWGNVNIFNHQYKNEEFVSKKKYDALKKGIDIDGVTYTLESIIQMSQTSWPETEWEFPKGRRNPKEKDLECSLREFEEETGIPQNQISVIENVMPFEEIFVGSNFKSYKHKYFLAFVNDFHLNLSHFQLAEVSKLEWKRVDECLESIRPYNLEKKQMIQNINKVLNAYRLYS